jgi:Tfp pilus assembly protein PilO
MISCSRKQGAIIVVAIAVVAVFFGGLYLPLTRKLAAIRADQRQFNTEATQTSNDATRLPALSDQLKKMRATVGNFSSRVPPSRQLGEFMQTVAKIMNEQKLQDQLVQPGTAIKTREIACIPVDIQCQGDLRQVFGFLRSLEEVDRAIRFETVELTTERTFNGKVSLHSRAYIYYKDTSGAEI